MTVIVQRAFWTGRRIAQATGAVLLVATAATGLGLLVWAGSYAPLVVTGGTSPIVVTAGASPHSAARVHPLFSSVGGFGQHFLVRPGAVEIGFGVINDGRWAVEIDRMTPVPVARQQFAVTRVVLNARGPLARPLRAHGWKIRIKPNRGASPDVTFRVRCPADQPRGTFSMPLLAMRIHYRYLHRLSRSQDVALPYPMTLRC